jgi:hypothetical protein
LPHAVVKDEKAAISQRQGLGTTPLQNSDAHSSSGRVFLNTDFPKERKGHSKKSDLIPLMQNGQVKIS